VKQDGATDVTVRIELVVIGRHAQAADPAGHLWRGATPSMSRWTALSP
jgi:hypothetical protein